MWDVRTEMKEVGYGISAPWLRSELKIFNEFMHKNWSVNFFVFFCVFETVFSLISTHSFINIDNVLHAFLKDIFTLVSYKI